jgi:hypothetical protein
MKNTTLVLAAIVVIGWFSPGEARAIDYRLEVGMPTYQWKEHFSAGTPRESGPLLTLGGYVSGFPWESAPAATLRGDFEMFLTRVPYSTFTQSLSGPTAVTPVDTHSDYLGFRYEGSLGRRFGSEVTGVEPFLGLGVRWWLRYIETTDAATGYPELYHTLYGRVGVRANRAFGERFLLHGAASIDPLLWAQERIDWTDISGEKLTVRNGKRAGWTIELGVGDGSLDGTVYWRATRLGKSNAVSCLGGTSLCSQPESDQDIIGMKLGFVF